MQAGPGVTPAALYAERTHPAMKSALPAGGDVFLSLLGGILGEKNPENGHAELSSAVASLAADGTEPTSSTPAAGNFKNSGHASKPPDGQPVSPARAHPGLVMTEAKKPASATKSVSDLGVLATSSALPAGTKISRFSRPSWPERYASKPEASKVPPVRPTPAKSEPSKAGRSTISRSDVPSMGDVWVTSAAAPQGEPNATRSAASSAQPRVAIETGSAIQAQPRASAMPQILSFAPTAAAVLGIPSSVMPAVAGSARLGPVSGVAFWMHIAPADPGSPSLTTTEKDSAPRDSRTLASPVSATGPADHASPPSPFFDLNGRETIHPASAETPADTARSLARSVGNEDHTAWVSAAQAATPTDFVRSQDTIVVTDPADAYGATDLSVPDREVRPDMDSPPLPAEQPGWPQRESPRNEGTRETDRIQPKFVSPASKGKPSPADLAARTGNFEAATERAASPDPVSRVESPEPPTENASRTIRPLTERPTTAPAENTQPVFASANAAVLEGPRNSGSALEPPSPATPESPSMVARGPQPVADLNNGGPQQPMRQISLKLASPGSASVDVQLTQKAGKLQVAVRTQDPQLTQSLQTGLGDLVGRLQDRGFKSQAWIPSAHPVTPVVEPFNPAGGHLGADHRDSGAGRQQHQDHSGSSDANRRQRGRWTAQLKRTLSQEAGEKNA